MALGLLPRRETADNPAKPRKRWTLIGSAILIVVLLAATAVVFWPTSKVADTSGLQVINNAPAAPAAGAVGPCNFPEPVSPDPVNIVPSDITWQLSGTMAAPSSPSAGPLYTTGGIATCFARTPSGVLVAISDLLANMANTNLDLRAVADQRLVHSTGYDQIALGMQNWVETAKQQPDTLLRQIAGFRLITYSPDFAVIDIVQRGTGGAVAGLLATQTYLMQWSDDDWKMVPPIDGTTMPSHELTNIESPYIPFNGA